MIAPGRHIIVPMLQAYHTVRVEDGIHGVPIPGRVLRLFPTAAVPSEQGHRPTHSAGTVAPAGHVETTHGAAISAVPSATGTGPETAEQIEEGFPETATHKTVRYGIATRRRVGQQLEEADGRVAQIVVDGARPEQGHRVDHVQRCPADEKLQHHYEEHFDDAFFVRQTLFHVGSGQHVNSETKTGKLVALID